MNPWVLEIPSWEESGRRDIEVLLTQDTSLWWRASRESCWKHSGRNFYDTRPPLTLHFWPIFIHRTFSVPLSNQKLQQDQTCSQISLSQPFSFSVRHFRDISVFSLATLSNIIQQRHSLHVFILGPRGLIIYTSWFFISLYWKSKAMNKTASSKSLQYI